MLPKSEPSSGDVVAKLTIVLGTMGRALAFFWANREISPGTGEAMGVETRGVSGIALVIDGRHHDGQE
jgi:hypothetical protein